MESRQIEAKLTAAIADLVNREGSLEAIKSVCRPAGRSVEASELFFSFVYCFVFRAQF